LLRNAGFPLSITTVTPFPLINAERVTRLINLITGCFWARM
jgi:hypothetical protein